VERIVTWVLLLCATTACARSAASPACPAGYASDPTRAAELSAALKRDADGRVLWQRTGGQFAVCFAPGGAGVIQGRTLLLDESAERRHTLARAAHLLHHLAEGVETTSGDPHARDERAARAVEARVLARGLP
jgi:hypothetical protein